MEIAFSIILLMVIILSYVIYFRYKVKKSKYLAEIKKYEETIKRINEEAKEAKRKEIINREISNSLNSAQKGIVEFEESMKKLANFLRIEFTSEYCGIGKIIKGAKVLFEDYATSFEEKDDAIDKANQINAMQDVKQADVDDSNYFISEAFKRETSIVIFNETEVKSKNNKNVDIYKSKILKSGNIVNIAVVKIKDISDNDDIGYIQFVNTESINLDEIKEYSESLSQLIEFAIQNDYKKKELKEKSKLVDDASFITTLILDNKDNVDTILDRIMSYLIIEFNAAIITFRIPILNGAERKIYFYLRRCKVDNNILRHTEIENHYYSKRELRPFEEMGGRQGFKCYGLDKIIIDDVLDTGFYSEFSLDNIIGTKKSIILPIHREVDRKNCYQGHPELCKPNDCNTCKDKYQNLYGVFKLRVCNEIENFDFINERLKKLSLQITFILNSIVDKQDQLTNKQIQKNLKVIDFNKLYDFDKQCVSAIKSITQAKECSIYRIKKNQKIVNGQYTDDEILYLSASTCKNVLFQDKQYPISEVRNQLFYSLTEMDCLIVEVFKSKKPLYLHNSKVQNHQLNKYLELINEDFTNKAESSSSIELRMKGESLYFSPIIKGDGECIGVVLLIGKKENNLNVSKTYWDLDKEYNELIVDIIARLAEAHEVQLGKEKFLSELAHEMLFPITEIIHNNDDVMDMHERDKYCLSKESLISIIKDNLNSSFSFKQIMEGIEFNYSSSSEEIKCYPKLEKEPQKIIIKAIRTFEKFASAEKQIVIIPNITEMPPLFIDKNRMMQVFINLIRNAIYYSFQGTKIEIYYKKVEMSFENKEIRKWHEIKFVNWGIGIPEADVDKIFQLYKRGSNVMKIRASGTGMGLYIVRKIMVAHGGYCEVRKLNNPTEISIFIPDNLKI